MKTVLKERAMYRGLEAYNMSWRFILKFLIICSLFPGADDAQALSKKNVLILHSYHQGRLWTDQITEGVQSVLQENNIEGEIYIEYMDTKRFFDGLDGQFIQNLLSSYEMKYRSIDLDVIIASDDNAFQLLLQHHHTLFSGVPVVFCGVNHFQDEMLAGHPDVTGVLETLDREPTLELAMQLHPEAKHIAFITDTTTTGKGNRRILEDLAARHNERIHFIFIDNKGQGISHSELLAALKELPEDAIIYFSDFNRYKDGTYVYQRDLLKELSVRIQRPIYSPYSILLGAGIVGGRLNNGFYQGQAAAAMAVRILQGEDIGTIPVQRKSPDKYEFDYRQLTRFNISETHLPEGSLVRYEPGSFYFHYKRYVWLSILFAGLQALAIIVLVANIKRRKTVERDLFESEQRAHGIFEQAAVGIAVVATDGRWLRVNQKLCDIVGYNREEMLQMTFQDITHQDDLEIGFQYLGPLLVNEMQTCSFQKRYVRKDQQHIWIHLTVSRVWDDTLGKPKYFVAIIEDITSRKDMERKLIESNEQLRHAEKLSAIGKLSASIAHEFNNPLAGIQSVIEGVDRNVALDEQSHELIHLALSECDRMKNLIKKLQDFNRPSSGLQQPVDVHQLLDDMIVMVQKEFNQYHILLQRNYAPELPMIRVVIDQIKQVLLNVLSNAQDAIHEDSGVVTITTEKLQDNKIAVRISDTGKGINEEDLAHIFEPFFTTKSAVKGTGLGLSVSYGIIKAHGGEILVDSLPNRGTIFSIILPVNPEKHEDRV